MLPIIILELVERKSEILEKLTEYRDDNELVFSWPFIKDNIENFQAINHWK